MQNIDSKIVFSGIRPGGCVQPYLEGFTAELISAGYAVLSIRDYVRSASHLGRWLDSRKLDVGRLNEAVIDDFAEHDCECPFIARRGRRLSRRYVSRARRFVAYLARLSVAPTMAASAPKRLPAPLTGFRAWMIQHRGVKGTTVDRCERLIEKMLPALGCDTERYSAAPVRRVFLREIDSLTRSYAKTYATALRTFLRFLATHGRCPPNLDRAIPTVPEWRLTALPRYLERNDIDRLIDSCDVSKSLGLRDRAILLLLVRLGLRAGDIVSMRIEDLDWQAGTLRVLGKGRKEVCLPLVQDAGDALLEYLVNARPKIDCDRVFLCFNAPVRHFTNSSTVSGIVCSALRRAGILNPPSKGAHLLRHSAATDMLRSGASLDAISTVLRHQSTDSTAYYAKVDIKMLSKILQSW